MRVQQVSADTLMIVDSEIQYYIKSNFTLIEFYKGSHCYNRCSFDLPYHGIEGLSKETLNIQIVLGVYTIFCNDLDLLDRLLTSHRNEFIKFILGSMWQYDCPIGNLSFSLNNLSGNDSIAMLSKTNAMKLSLLRGRSKYNSTALAFLIENNLSSILFYANNLMRNKFGDRYKYTDFEKLLVNKINNISVALNLPSTLSVLERLTLILKKVPKDLPVNYSDSSSIHVPLTLVILLDSYKNSLVSK